MNKEEKVRSVYMYTGKREAQVLNLQNCPPCCIQGHSLGARIEKTRLPSIHECMRRKLTLRTISESFTHIYIPTVHRRNNGKYHFAPHTHTVYEWRDFGT